MKQKPNTFGKLDFQKRQVPCKCQSGCVNEVYHNQQHTVSTLLSTLLYDKKATKS